MKQFAALSWESKDLMIFYDITHEEAERLLASIEEGLLNVAIQSCWNLIGIEMERLNYKKRHK